ncbi:MAG: AAC(3)-I family aminoglycoside N-acetyltransferase [Alphaproteobacteria bacterium]|jgi:aminoglycoside 3-N-acetyltransferase I|nr:AAC(3)-I family aminoglycoside N-acetyltransferase [Alphaproteobacteria bacterium]
MIRAAGASIRRLGPADDGLVPAVTALFAEAFEEPQTYSAAPPGPAWRARLLGDPRVIVLAALDDGAVVGALVAYDLPKLEQERSEIYIYDLAVAAAHRRRGIATALIEETRAIAAACGAWVIYVQADHGDDPAVALYTKLGQREDVLHFDIAVPAKPKG